MTRTPRIARHLVWLAAIVGTLAAAPADAEILSRWIQYDAAGGAEARIATNDPTCPQVSIDGEPRITLERAAPSGEFPFRVCTLRVAPGAGAVAIGGETLRGPSRDPRRIVVVGDTGCRLLGDRFQACNDPKEWPFPVVAASAARLNPDLVIHVGDYYYREAPCGGGSNCQGSPTGDTWAAWDADFFAPARPLLTAAPWIFVRGNHEDCKRGGKGWMRLLEPRAYGTCAEHQAPYVMVVPGLSLVVLDTAIAEDRAAPADLVAKFEADYAWLRQNVSGPNWILSHHPLHGLTSVRGQLTGGNKTLIAAAGRLPDSVELLLSGHVHAFEALNYAADSPPQIIAGNGGDWLDQGIPEKLDGQTVLDAVIAEGVSGPSFGFMTLDRTAEGWTATRYDTSGRALLECRVAARRVACGGR
jgi:hypothetical protein